MSYLFLPLITLFLPTYHQTDQMRLAQISLPLVLSFSQWSFLSSKSKVYDSLFIVVCPVPSIQPVMKSCLICICLLDSWIAPGLFFLFTVCLAHDTYPVNVWVLLKRFIFKPPYFCFLLGMEWTLLHLFSIRTVLWLSEWKVGVQIRLWTFL